MEYIQVPAVGEERGDVAAYLIELAKERGFNHKLILSNVRGFMVPVEWDLEGSEVNEVTPFVQVDKVEDGSNLVFPEPDVQVTVGEDGSLWIQAVTPPTFEAEVEAAVAGTEPLPYREQVRAWAKENGYPVGDRGAIKKEIVTYYELAIGQAEAAQS